jgi:glycerophosphoryl diester phosphodiesterase
MIVISHRGSNRKAPENSMQAFELSIDEGATRIELDLWLSKDNNIFICHDDNTSRTTSHKLRISESTTDQLEKVRLENGEPLPSLDMVLTLLPKVELNLELKGKDLNLVDAVSNKISSLPNLDKIILSSFNVEILEKLNQDCPNIRRAYLWEPDLKDKLSINLGRIKEGLKRANTHIFHPEASSYNKKLAEFSTFEDLEVYTWAFLREKETINNLNLWQKLIDLEVDGHCTNYPLEFSKYLRDKLLK